MSKKRSDRALKSPARRHFLAVTSAAGARIAAVAALAGISSTTSATARARGGMTRSYRGNGGTPGDGGGGGGGGGGGATQCFLRATRIMTDRGEVAVEALKAGDLVQTLDGGFAPIRWVGRSVYQKTARDWPADVKPIRIARSAISEGVPHRDLYLSPWHFLYLDGHLMPAKDLVNDMTITAATPANTDTIEYFHVLLDSHDVLLAEGVAAESLLLKAGEHENFSNFAEYERRLGGDVPAEMTPYAPRVWYSGGRSHLTAMMRLGASHIVDVRDPIQRVNQRLIARAEALAPALAA